MAAAVNLARDSDAVGEELSVHVSLKETDLRRASEALAKPKGESFIILGSSEELRSVEGFGVEEAVESGAGLEGRFGRRSVGGE